MIIDGGRCRGDWLSGGQQEENGPRTRSVGHDCRQPMDRQTADDRPREGARLKAYGTPHKISTRSSRSRGSSQVHLEWHYDHKQDGVYEMFNAKCKQRQGSAASGRQTDSPEKTRKGFKLEG